MNAHMKSHHAGSSHSGSGAGEGGAAGTINRTFRGPVIGRNDSSSSESESDSDSTATDTSSQSAGGGRFGKMRDARFGSGPRPSK
jgi:hypothetical protein